MVTNDIEVQTLDTSPKCPFRCESLIPSNKTIALVSLTTLVGGAIFYFYSKK